jgi:hypothetical protein
MKTNTDLRTTSLALRVLAVAALAHSALATDITYVADTTDDRIYRLRDLNADGDYNDPNEVGIFYDNAFGSIPMTSPNGLVVAPDGTVLVCDSNTDLIIALRDLDLDGSALDAGEATVFFNGTTGGNASGVQMVAANALALGPGGVVWVASNNQIIGSIIGDDAILRLEDLNADGDADDLGEARVFYAPALGSGGVGDSIPTGVKVGLDGAIYYAENGVTGVLAKAIWRLEDSNGNGTIQFPGEAQVFFAIPPQPSNVFLWDVEQGPDGAWYVSDRGNEILWRARDTNGNAQIGAGEFSAWFTGSAPSDLWTVRVASDGSLYGCEAAEPDRIRRFVDTNANNVIGAGELGELYDETLAAFNISNPRSIALAPDFAPPASYCTAGTSTNGCTPAIGFSGAPSASASSGFTLSASGVEGQKQGLIFYGASGALALPWGTGSSLLCVKSPTQRLPASNSAGTLNACDGVLASDWLAFVSSTPGAIGAPLAAGDVFQAQAWYRDPPASKSTNLSNALEFTVTP